MLYRKLGGYFFCRLILVVLLSYIQSKELTKSVQDSIPLASVTVPEGVIRENRVTKSLDLLITRTQDPSSSVDSTGLPCWWFMLDRLSPCSSG